MSEHPTACLFKLFPNASHWHGFLWLDKSLQKSSLAFYTSVSSLRYHLRQTTLFPITALPNAWAAVPQHAEEPAGTCPIREQPWRWVRDLSRAAGWRGLPGAPSEASCAGTASPAHWSRAQAGGLLLASCGSDAVGQGAGSPQSQSVGNPRRQYRLGMKGGRAEGLQGAGG